MAKSPKDITQLLMAWTKGDEEAIDEVVALLYPELRRIARHQLARQAPDHTLQSAALVNEAYLKLIHARGIRCENRSHFFALSAQIIRNVLVDYARKYRYAKRGGGAAHIPLDEAVLGTRARGMDVLALHETLVALSRIDARKGRVVELRYFGGLTVEETANVLQISPETVLRDWKMAKVWLFRELGRMKEKSRSAE